MTRRIRIGLAATALLAGASLSACVETVLIGGAAAVVWSGVHLIPLAGLRVTFAVATAAGLAQTAGMLTLLPPANFQSARAHWRSARTLFALQLLAFAAIPSIGWMLGKPLSDWLEGPNIASNAVLALLWIAFAAPHLGLFVALRGTRGGLKRRTNVGDALLG